MRADQQLQETVAVPVVREQLRPAEGGEFREEVGTADVQWAAGLVWHQAERPDRLRAGVRIARVQRQVAVLVQGVQLRRSIAVPVGHAGTHAPRGNERPALAGHRLRFTPLQPGLSSHARNQPPSGDAAQDQVRHPRFGPLGRRRPDVARGQLRRSLHGA